MSITSTITDIRKAAFESVNDAQDLVLDLHRAAADTTRAVYSAFIPESLPGRSLLEQQAALAREIAVANVKFASELTEVWLPAAPATK